MSTATKIEWTDRTWNPVRGCSVISPGCVNCYAMKQAHRFSGPGGAYEGLTKLTERSGPQWTGRIKTVDGVLLDPLRWRKPERIFVNSMSDLFHEDVPEAFIDRVFAVMALAPRHVFQVLTKRPDRMRAYVADAMGLMNRRGRVIGIAWEMLGNTRNRLTKYRHENIVSRPWPLPNVWLGVSVENQKYADERIPLLLETPAAVRFISAEPLLGPLDLADSGQGTSWFSCHQGCNKSSESTCLTYEYSNGRECFRGLDWVIVGGESGPGARPMQLEWAESIIRQCRAARVPVFVKQLGSLWRGVSFRVAEGVNQRITHRKAGEITEWPADLRVRQFPVPWFDRSAERPA